MCKKSFFISIIIIFLQQANLLAQNDTIFFMKNGVIIAKYDINTDRDSILFYTPIVQESDYFMDSRDNNIYHKTTIGSQVWMTENLRYLPFVVGSDSVSAYTPYCYVYNYEGTSVIEAKSTTNYNTYGVLYNWVAAMDGSSSSTSNPSGVQGICPNGWHLPSYDEWTQLLIFCGGDTIAGGKLKEEGITHWNSPNVGATNDFGFTVLPGGGNGNQFNGMGAVGIFWNATSTTEIGAKTCEFGFGYKRVYRFNYYRNNAFSVRCIRD